MQTLEQQNAILSRIDVINKKVRMIVATNSTFGDGMNVLGVGLLKIHI
jgi:hypothetical protein